METNTNQRIWALTVTRTESSSGIYTSRMHMLCVAASANRHSSTRQVGAMLRRGALHSYATFTAKRRGLPLFQRTLPPLLSSTYLHAVAIPSPALIPPKRPLPPYRSACRLLNGGAEPRPVDTLYALSPAAPCPHIRQNRQPSRLLWFGIYRGEAGKRALLYLYLPSFSTVPSISVCHVYAIINTLCLIDHYTSK